MNFEHLIYGFQLEFVSTVEVLVSNTLVMVNTNSCKHCLKTNWLVK